VTLISADCDWAPAPVRALADPPLLGGYFPASLAYGLVTAETQLAGFLLECGCRDEQLAWFAAHPEPPDLLGFNFYPGEGISDPVAARETLLQRARDTHALLPLPLYLTETSAGLTEPEKLAWIGALGEFFTQAWSEGLPLRGLNWWPLYETIQWHYRDNTKTVEECIEPGGWNNGLYTIAPQPSGRLERRPTAAVAAYRELLTSLAQAAPR
jgi:dTDP-4-dehydrorhamnose reductase